GNQACGTPAKKNRTPGGEHRTMAGSKRNRAADCNCGKAIQRIAREGVDHSVNEFADALPTGARSREINSRGLRQATRGNADAEPIGDQLPDYPAGGGNEQTTA